MRTNNVLWFVGYIDCLWSCCYATFVISLHQEPLTTLAKALKHIRHEFNLAESERDRYVNKYYYIIVRPKASWDWRRQNFAPGGHGRVAHGFDPKLVVTKSSRSESHLALGLQNLRAFANSTCPSAPWLATSLPVGLA